MPSVEHLARKVCPLHPGASYSSYEPMYCRRREACAVFSPKQGCVVRSWATGPATDVTQHTPCRSRQRPAPAPRP